MQLLMLVQYSPKFHQVKSSSVCKGDMDLDIDLHQHSTFALTYKQFYIFLYYSFKKDIPYFLKWLPSPQKGLRLLAHTPPPIFCQYRKEQKQE